MNVPWTVIVVSAATVLPTSVGAQIGGNLAAFPPVELQLQIITVDDRPTIAPTEFELVTGDYYRLNVTADGGADWRFEVDELLQNSHLRVVTIDGIEVHLQGMVFRALEFDVAGTAQFSFTPIRPGTYEFSVGSVPSATGQPIGTGGTDQRAARGRFVVR